MRLTMKKKYSVLVVIIMTSLIYVFSTISLYGDLLADKEQVSAFLKQKKLTEAVKMLQQIQNKYKENLQPVAGLFLQTGNMLRNNDLKTSLSLIDTGLKFGIVPADYKSLYYAIHIKFVDGGMNHAQKGSFLQEMQKRYGNDERIAAQITKKQRFLDFLGQDAPEFTGKGSWNNTGESVTLRGLKGKYVLLDFFAPWCPDCRRSLDAYLSLKERLKDKLEAVMVTRLYGFYADENTKAVRDLSPQEEKNYLDKYIKKKNITIPVFIADTDEIFQAYAASSIPHFVLISPEGRVIQLCMERIHSFFDNVEKIVNSPDRPLP